MQQYDPKPVEVVNNLTTNDANKALSAAQGYTLNNDIYNKTKGTAITKIDSPNVSISYYAGVVVNNIAYISGYVTVTATVTAIATFSCTPSGFRFLPMVGHKKNSSYVYMTSAGSVHCDAGLEVGNYVFCWAIPL